MKWWQVVPVGAVLTELDRDGGIAIFECDWDGQQELGRWTVDLFTDEVTS